MSSINGAKQAFPLIEIWRWPTNSFETSKSIAHLVKTQSRDYLKELGINAGQYLLALSILYSTLVEGNPQ